MKIMLLYDNIHIWFKYQSVLALNVFLPYINYVYILNIYLKYRIKKSLNVWIAYVPLKSITVFNKVSLIIIYNPLSRVYISSFFDLEF